LFLNPSRNLGRLFSEQLSLISLASSGSLKKFGKGSYSTNRG
jgi:hypothetical protein